MSDSAIGIKSRQLGGNHPEMRDVDLERDDLIYFKADQSVRDVIIGNNYAGTNDPFLGGFFLLDEDSF